MVLAGTVGAQGICVTQDRHETLEKRYWCVSDGVKSWALSGEVMPAGEGVERSALLPLPASVGI